MKLAIEASHLLVSQKTGVEWYAHELVMALAEILPNYPNIEPQLYFNAGNSFADANMLNQYDSILKQIPSRVYRPSKGYGLALSTFSVLDRVDVLHLTAPALVRAPTFSLVVTFHDLVNEKLDDYDTYKDAGFSSKSLEASRRARVLIANSYATRNDLIDVYGIAPRSIHVTHLGVSSRYFPDPEAAAHIMQKYDIGPFILNLSSVQYRKNQKRLLEAFHLLKQRCDLPHTLVIAGRNGPGNEEVYETLKTLQLGSVVKMLDYVPTGDVSQLYSAADLVIYPSLYEGFGLPIGEALACGAVVATSNTTSLPEVGGDAVIYFNPYEVEEITQAMLEGLTNPTLRQQLRKKGPVQAGKFTWIQTAKKSIAAYLQATE